MIIKEYASLRKTPVAKIKATYRELFNEEPPNELTNEQIDKIDVALGESAQKHLSASDKLAVPGSSGLSEEKQEAIANIIGSEILEKNAQLYNQVLIRSLQKSLLGEKQLLEMADNARSQMYADYFNKGVQGILKVNGNLEAVMREHLDPMTVNPSDLFSSDMTEETKQSMLLELQAMGFKV